MALELLSIFSIAKLKKSPLCNSLFVEGSQPISTSFLGGRLEGWEGATPRLHQILCLATVNLHCFGN